ncbi:cytochrome P450 [Xylaria sp. FL0933]|nr:cytochrome P450 [Xylaria sp. FL0933]
MDVIIPVAALTAGVVSHLGYFRIGEHHLYSSLYALASISAFVLSIVVHTFLFELSTRDAALRTFSIATSYFTGLYSSLIIYRLFFHPLREFPGPLGCKVSSAWFATYLTRLDAFNQLTKLHKEHGNFVRVGSNDLSIAHPKAVQAIYGLGSKCLKGDWYDLTYPTMSLQTARDDNLHSRWRRVWSGAFGERSLQDYEERMVQYRALLVKVIEDSAGSPIDMTKLFSYYNYDVMGELAFGHSFDMLGTNKENEAIKLYNTATVVLGLKLPMWFFRLLTGIPGATKAWWAFKDYCTAQLNNRMQRKADKRDIIGSLLNHFDVKGPMGFDRVLLEGDAQLIIVAGSETVAITSISIFRYLAQYPHHVGILRTEIDPLRRNEQGNFIYTDLSNLKHLNGVINEALRLFPPVPTILPRVTPPEGLDIDGTFIPGNTTVFCPQFVIGRGSESYASPDEFIPERWYSQPELIRDASGFAPFSAGSYNCVGRPLALLSIRAVVARIIADYDIRATPIENLLAYDEGVKEYFTLIPPELKLSFVKRQVPEPKSK